VDGQSVSPSTHVLVVPEVAVPDVLEDGPLVLLEFELPEPLEDDPLELLEPPDSPLALPEELPDDDGS